MVAVADGHAAVLEPQDRALDAAGAVPHLHARAALDRGGTSAAAGGPVEVHRAGEDAVATHGSGPYPRSRGRPTTPRRFSECRAFALPGAGNARHSLGARPDTVGRRDPRGRRRRGREPAGQAAVRRPVRSRCRAATAWRWSASTGAASPPCSACWPARSSPRPAPSAGAAAPGSWRWPRRPTCRPARSARRWAARGRPRPSPTGSAWASCSTRTSPRCRAGRPSGWRWPARCPRVGEATRATCSSSTSPPTTSTSTPSPGSRTAWPGSGAGWCSSPTTATCSTGSPPASSSSTGAPATSTRAATPRTSRPRRPRRREATAETKRRNLARAELAWLRRGAPGPHQQAQGPHRQRQGDHRGPRPRAPPPRRPAARRPRADAPPGRHRWSSCTA